MSRLDQVLRELAPGGVPFKLLGDIAELVRGNGMPKSDLTEVGVGAIHYGQIYTRYGAWTEHTSSFVAPDSAARLAKVLPGDIIITNTSENIEDVGKAVAWLGDEPIVTGGHATVIRHNEDPKYLSYWFQSESFRQQKRALATGTKVIDVSAKQLTKVRVPVPPLMVQREIVRVLDRCTKLESELEGQLNAEREARALQYAHYRDALLNAPGGGARVVSLSEVATYVRGVTYSKGDEVRAGEPGHRLLRSNNIDLSTNRLKLDDVRVIERAVRIRDDQWLKGGDILISAASGSRAHVGKVAFIEDGTMDLTFGGFMAAVRPNKMMLPRFLFHLLVGSAFSRYLDATIASTTINNLTGEVVGKFEVSVPSLEEQQRIVGVLDIFESRANELSERLSAELAARRKQYAYYRDKLLTFEEAAA